jgi:hypothetical protein
VCLTDNAKSYRRSWDWIAVCSALQIQRRFTKIRCPWTNGKACEDLDRRRQQAPQLLTLPGCGVLTAANRLRELGVRVAIRASAHRSAHP